MLTIPTIPTLPTIPTIPTIPTTPTFPTLPHIPALFTGAETPSVTTFPTLIPPALTTVTPAVPPSPPPLVLPSLPAVLPSGFTFETLTPADIAHIATGVPVTLTAMGPAGERLFVPLNIPPPTQDPLQLLDPELLASLTLTERRELVARYAATGLLG